MTNLEKQELEFYKNGSAESVLKRFVFSEKEEKLVRDAIRTANMPNPRMVLICQADALLKDVAKMREPILPAEKTEVSVEAMTQIELLRLSATNKQTEANFNNKIPTLFGFNSKFIIIFTIIMLMIWAVVQYFMANKVAESSTKQAKYYEKQATGTAIDY